MRGLDQGIAQVEHNLNANKGYAAAAETCGNASALQGGHAGGTHARLNGHVVLTLSAADARILLAQAKRGASVVAALSDYPTEEFHVLQRIVRALETC